MEDLSNILLAILPGPQMVYTRRQPLQGKVDGITAEFLLGYQVA